MQKITSILNNQQGSVIVIAVIILVLLTVIGISATNTSTTEMQISTNAVLHNVALYTADSGIEAGRAALNNIKIADVGSWDNLLSQESLCTVCLIDNGIDDCTDCYELRKATCSDDCYALDNIIGDAGRTVGPAAFTLKIVDNDDLDGNPLVDSDDTIELTSTLVSPYRNATATISTTVRGGESVYAQEHYNSGNSSVAGLETETASGTERW
jgi:hypothetical protein